MMEIHVYIDVNLRKSNRYRENCFYLKKDNVIYLCIFDNYLYMPFDCYKSIRLLIKIGM